MNNRMRRKSINPKRWKPSTGVKLCLNSICIQEHTNTCWTIFFWKKNMVPYFCDQGESLPTINQGVKSLEVESALDDADSTGVTQHILRPRNRWGRFLKPFVDWRGFLGGLKKWETPTTVTVEHNRYLSKRKTFSVRTFSIILRRVTCFCLRKSFFFCRFFLLALLLISWRTYGMFFCRFFRPAMLWRMAIVQAGHEVIEVGFSSLWMRVIPWVQPPSQDASDH